MHRLQFMVWLIDPIHFMVLFKYVYLLVSEVSEPSVRGTLLSLSTVARNAGIFVVYLLGSFLSWRQVSLACSSVPILILIAICFVNKIKKLLNLFKAAPPMSKFPFFSVWRFLNLPTIFCSSNGKKMHKNHYNGFAVGSNRFRFKMNLKSFKITFNWWMHAACVPINGSRVNIQRQPFLIKSKSSNENVI